MKRIATFSIVALIVGCVGAASPPTVPGAQGSSTAGGGAPCAAEACKRARGILASASAFSNVKHDYVLDPTSSFAPGRGLELLASGSWAAAPTECARPKWGGSAPKVDPTNVDFGFVGLAVDNVLVGADADITPFFSAGGSATSHSVKLVALAFVRDLDPQFFAASDDVTYGEEKCACGRATHFVGAVKMGGMLSYELDVRSGEAHGKAIELVKARIEAQGSRLQETRVGGLEVEGLDEALRGGATTGKPLSFKVTQPVPVAYAVYPIADVCKFALPAPDVTPQPVDFGLVPYGTDATRLVHVVNRASIELTATLGARAFDVPALGSVDLPVGWIPRGETVGCEGQTRDEALVFTPKDPHAPAVPRQQSVRLVEQVRTGKGAILKAEHVDTGEGRILDYTTTSRDWQCPADYKLVGCHAEHAQCSDERHDCSQDFTLTASTVNGNGCHFACSGPRGYLSKAYCRFDAVMECRLACP